MPTGKAIKIRTAVTPRKDELCPIEPVRAKDDRKPGSERPQDRAEYRLALLIQIEGGVKNDQRHQPDPNLAAAELSMLIVAVTRAPFPNRLAVSMNSTARSALGDAALMPIRRNDHGA